MDSIANSVACGKLSYVSVYVGLWYFMLKAEKAIPIIADRLKT